MVLLSDDPTPSNRQEGMSSRCDTKIIEFLRRAKDEGFHDNYLQVKDHANWHMDYSIGNGSVLKILAQMLVQDNDRLLYRCFTHHDQQLQHDMGSGVMVSCKEDFTNFMKEVVAGLRDADRGALSAKGMAVQREITI